MIWEIYAFIGTIALSLAYIIEKRSLIETHPLQFATVLAMFSVILSIFIIPFVDIGSLNIQLVLLIYIDSWGWAIGGWYLIKAIRHMQLSSTTPLLNFSPAFVAIAAFIFLNDVITTRQIFGIGLLVIGTYILETHNKESLLHPFKETFKSKYTRYIFISIFVSATASILDKYLLGFISSFTLIFVIQIFLLVNFLMIMYHFQKTLKPMKLGLKNAGIWIFLVAALIIIKRVTIAHAMSITHVSLVVAITQLSTLFTVLMGGEIFHEKNLFKKSIATIIMIAGVFLII